jgi:hypothetical protein
VPRKLPLVDRQTDLSNRGVMPLTWGGATGIRTPDLLHAISRHHVHRSASPQVTVPERTHRSIQIRAGCGTFLLYSFHLRPIRMPFPRGGLRPFRCYPPERSREPGEGPGRPPAPGEWLRETDRGSATARRRSFGDRLWGIPVRDRANDWLTIWERDRPPEDVVGIWHLGTDPFA